MAKLSHSDSTRMYSWWWDSHISPKNSKWLQENLTDMDAKVKVMIKLIEEDADSFARRAEMYYKKRPELMKMVEEFYRAYRAMAERYDHATGVIRQAHRTMAEAQIPMFADESPVGSFAGNDPRTPEMLTRNGDFTDEYDSVAKKKGLKAVERVRKGLNFDEVDEKEKSMVTNDSEKKFSKSDQKSESDEIRVLKEALAKMEAEKEAGLAQYQQSLDKLSQLEAEISKTQEDFRVLRDHASKAENEVIVLKEALTKLETEKESKLQEYQESLNRMTDLQNLVSTLQADANKLDERASSVETEAQSLKGELNKLTMEKDEALDQYMRSLGMISNLENKLRLTEEDARRLKERAENAEKEVVSLKETVSKLTEEKEAFAVQYQQCLETISGLEQKLTSAEEEAKHLSMEIDNGISKLKGAEEQCLLLERSNQSLHSELESLMLKMGTQSQELTEKQKELGRLWACVQEERLRFVEAETAFQTLQHLHAQTQEELRSMASELQNRAQLLNVVETHNQKLQDEVVKVKEEKKQVDELNASSAITMKDMENEISSLKESKGTLEQEVELRIDQRNALQQEIYCLKEELNGLNNKHILVMDQVNAVGLDPDSLGSSVKKLQDENSELKETIHRESREKAALLEKLKIMEQLLEKNSILEMSLSDLNAELEAVRGKIETLERSCQSLLEEKSTLLDEKATLMIQLQETNKNLENVSDNNTVLENSLSDALHQLEALQAKSKKLEDSCQLLANEKASLTSEKDGLTSQLESTRGRLEDLGRIYGELEGRCITLEKEKESTLSKIEELHMSLDVEKQKHASYIQTTEARFTNIEAEKHLLERECQWVKRELDQVTDYAVENEIEIFVLHRTAQELADNNLSVLIENQKLLEESSLSEKKLRQLEKNKVEQEVEIKSLSYQATNLRAGTSQLLKLLGIFEDRACQENAEQDNVYVNQLSDKLQIMKESLRNAEHENQQLSIELSVLLAWIKQLTQHSQNVEVEKSNIEHEFKFQTKQLLALQSEVLTVLDMNEELKSKLREETCNKEALVDQMEDLNRKLDDMHSTFQVLQREKVQLSEEKKYLMDSFQLATEMNNVLEENNHILCGDVLAQDTLSMIFRSFADEKCVELRKLGGDFCKLQGMNDAIADKLSLTEGKLEESKTANHCLQERLHKSEDELKDVYAINDQLHVAIADGKKLLSQLEIEIQEAEKKISMAEKEKLELNESVESAKMECAEVKTVRDSQEHQIAQLSAQNDQLSMENGRLHDDNNQKQVQQENLQFELESKINEINKLEVEAASVFGQFQYYMVSQLLYEQKFTELQEACFGYLDQNTDLKAQLAAYDPEIVALKECLSSLENNTDIHIKFQNPENEDMQGTQDTNDSREIILNEDEKAPTLSTISDLRNLRDRLQAFEKAAVEIKESMVSENVDLRIKLDASMRQLELLQSESGRYRRSARPTSEITEVDAILTKDIMLDQVSDGSSRGFRKKGVDDEDNQIVELWETAQPSGVIGLTVAKSKKVDSPSTTDSREFHRIKSVKKQKAEVFTSDTLHEKDFSVDKLEISKRFTAPLQDGNKRKVLERLDSDVQKLSNLQITVQDLKRKLGVTEKDKRGKAVIECEALKAQLEEADMAIVKLFDLNGKLTRSVEEGSASFSEVKGSFDLKGSFDVKSSFDLEGDETARRRKRVSEQARRMSEKIGRLQLEVQKLQFILLKLDDENKEGRSKVSEARKRILLKDYLYGGARKGQRRKKTQFCACVQPSTVEE